jgi:hypothetical protein
MCKQCINCDRLDSLDSLNLYRRGTSMDMALGVGWGGYKTRPEWFHVCDSCEANAKTLLRNAAVAV